MSEISPEPRINPRTPAELFADYPLEVTDLGRGNSLGDIRVGLDNELVSVELVFSESGGTAVCSIDWIGVRRSYQGQGIAAEAYSQVMDFAKKRGADRLVAVIISKASLRAAERAYGTGYTTEEWLDIDSRHPDDPGYLGPDHPNWLLEIDLESYGREPSTSN